MRPTIRASSAATASQVSTGALACAALNADCFAAKDKKCATRASLARRAELLRWPWRAILQEVAKPRVYRSRIALTRGKWQAHVVGLHPCLRGRAVR